MQPDSQSPVSLFSKLKAYAQLMRIDRPVGTYLLLWPTLCALWIAADGMPQWPLLLIFIAGVFLTRSAGCVINDYADRHIDGHVKRTKNRPIPAGLVSSKEALMLFAGLMLAAFLLVLLTNTFTILMSFGALALAFCYPFMKRYTHFPQIVLGAAFAWAIPMAFTATQNALPQSVWLFYIAVVLWTLAYDTMYAMVDRDDDVKIGVKSTAVLFGDADKIIIAAIQLLTLASLVAFGRQVELGLWYYSGVAACAAFFVYQQWLIRERQRDNCFKAFLNNHYAGMALFVAIVVEYMPENML